MNTYTKEFIEWLLDRYNTSEEELAALKKGNYSPYTLHEIILEFVDQTTKDATVEVI